MSPDTPELDVSTIERMLNVVAPDWTLQAAEGTAAGYLPTYRLDVGTPDGPDEVYLKASPPGGSHGVDLEARMLGILSHQTDIPVPEVYGVVDETDSICDNNEKVGDDNQNVADDTETLADDLPTPFFLMSAMPGVTRHRRNLGDIPDATLARVARDTGRHLADLHSVTGLDGYGYLAPNESRTYRGERPGGNVSQIRVVDPAPSWPEALEAMAEQALSGAAESRFADLVDDVKPVLDSHVADVEGSPAPAFGHVDAAIENLLHDPGTGEVTAVLDWAFTLSVTPAYDLSCVEWGLSGGPWRFSPTVPDRSETVRPALLEGYREVGAEAALERFERYGDCYDLLSLVRSMHLLEDWVEDVLDEPVEPAAANLRGRVADWL